MTKSVRQDEDTNTLEVMLRSVTRFVSRKPGLTLSMVLLVSCLAIGFTVQYIDFKTERSDLIDQRAEFHRRWMDYTKSFGEASDIVLVVESKDKARVREALNALGTQLKADSDHFTNVLYRIDVKSLRSKGLQFLTPEELVASSRNLDQLRSTTGGQWNNLKLDSLFNGLARQVQYSRSQNANTNSNDLMARADGLASSMNHYINNPKDFQSPWPMLMPVDPMLVGGTSDGSRYLTNSDGTLGFLKVRAVVEKGSFSGSGEAIEQLRTLAAETSEKYPKVSVGLTGIPVLEYDEMQRSQKDMTLASGISILGVGLIMFLGFRGFRHPGLAIAMLLISMTWAFGYTTLVIGHLNILSVSFAAILIGLGIDFAIHYLTRYLELRHEGEHLRLALLKSSSSVGTGIVTAAVTTALAFFCASFTSFLGIAELGIIAGGGILLCAVATFVVLPALIALADRRVEPQKLPTPFQANWLRTLTTRFPRLVLLGSLAVIVGLGSQMFEYSNGEIKPRISYDYNLLNLQAKGIDSVELQERVFEKADHSLLFGVAMADSEQEARDLSRKFEELSTVHHVECLASKLPSHSLSATSPYIREIQSKLSYLPSQPARTGSVDPNAVGSAIDRLYRQLREHRHDDAVKIAGKFDQFLDQFETLTLSRQASFLRAFQYRATQSLLNDLKAMAQATSLVPYKHRDLPRELTSRYYSRKDGKWLLQIYPKEQIWDVEPLAQFVEEVRTVDPFVTGTPFQNYEASRQIKLSYQDASIYALAVICLVLLIDFVKTEHKWLVLIPPMIVIVFTAAMLNTRRTEINILVLLAVYVAMSATIAALIDFRNFRDALLAMVPPVLGLVVLFGILGLAGVDLNPANLIVLPLVLGIGVDDGVHVIHDFRSQRGEYRTSASTMNAIMLTSLTSMVGFGSMMIAAHRGLYSVGLVLVIGVGSCLFVSLVLLPAVLCSFSNKNKKQQKSQQTEGGKNLNMQGSQNHGKKGHRQQNRAA